MSRPYWSVRYVPDLAGLPAKLEKGRAYFIGNEQYIIVDYGNGPIVYGGKPGPQGAPGEPQPQLQEQVDYLADTSIELTNHLFNLQQKFRGNQDAITDIKNDLEKSSNDFQGIITDTRDDLLRHVNANSEAIIELMNYTYDQVAKINNVISIVTKILTSLYPNADIDMNPEDKTSRVLTRGEIITIDNTSYKVKDSHVNSDGSVVVAFDVIEGIEQPAVLLLREGDSFTDTEGHVWTVENNELVNDEGVIRLSYQRAQELIGTLKLGDIVEYDGNKYIVSSVASGYSRGEISLTLTD